MTTSEPTTGEIVRALRICGTDSFRMGTCEICSYNGAGKETFGCIDKLDNDAADRLESQERRIAELTEELEAISEAATVLHGANESHWNEIKELTVRAEQAEADIKKFAHTSHTCGHNESGLCKLAADDHGFCEKCPAWEWRGLRGKGNA